MFGFAPQGPSCKVGAAHGLAAAFLGEVPAAQAPSVTPASSAGEGGAEHVDASSAEQDDAAGAAAVAAVEQQVPDPNLTYDQEALSPNPFAQAAAEDRSPPVCDPQGRISTARDGRTCDGDDACVTALPSDFCARFAGQPDLPEFCYKWVAPPYLGPPPCPPGAVACPPAPPSPAAYWEDQARTQLAGRPWCVKAEHVRRYAGPIELKCSASGPGAQAVGSPTGCWWLKEFAKEDIQRLSGPIRMSNLPPGMPRGVYVDDAPGVSALTEKQAEHWVVNGSLGPLPNGGRRGANQQFLPPIDRAVA